MLGSKSMIKTYAALAAIVALAACSAAEKSGIQIDTPQGPVIGVESKAGIQNYKAIPFAAPPVGDLRWRPPTPAPNWTEPRDASEFSAMCMQGTSGQNGFFGDIIEGHDLSMFKKFVVKRIAASIATPTTREDCLYLNVRTPNIVPGGTIKGPPLPVMVWIHGGAHQFGSGDMMYYQSDALPQKGVVLVTINYRLGAFGYMAHPALSEDDPRGVSGNYGTLDQIAALEWVKDNIAAYGGDPENVTIFGESAGGWSVTELIATPLAAGLFHKAIGQSGSSTHHLGQMDGGGVGWISGYETAAKLDAALSLTRPTASELRAIPAEAIVNASDLTMADGFNHVRDGVVFPGNVGGQFINGAINAVPIMIGYNTDDASLFFPNDPEPSVWIEDMPREGRSDQLEVLKPHYGSSAQALIDLYGLENPDTFDIGGTQMMGDELFGMNIRFAARQIAAQGQPAYTYSFGRVPPRKNQTVGAFHAAEIPFVFNSHEKILGFTKDDAALTDLMQNYWVG